MWIWGTARLTAHSWVSHFMNISVKSTKQKLDGLFAGPASFLINGYGPGLVE